MDIRSYFGASTSQAANSSDSEDSRPDSCDPELSSPSPSPSRCHLGEELLANETDKDSFE